MGPGAGFSVRLPQPLWLDDQVSLHGPDGSVTRSMLGERAAARLRELTCCFDPAARSGLEIGALDCPLIPRGRFSIWRADQAPREELAARYAHGIAPSMIVEPDFVTGTLPLAVAVGGRRFGYVVASHVMEHVPDMIGWLWQVWSVLEDGGVLALALPHGGHTFDSHRRLSTMADLADAFFAGLVRPSPRQIIDAMTGSAQHGGADMGRATFEAVHKANHSRKTGLYVDVHCHVFTPESFADLLGHMDAVELLGFDVLRLSYLGTDEFFVSLRRNSGKRLPDHIGP